MFPRPSEFCTNNFLTFGFSIMIHGYVEIRLASMKLTTLAEIEQNFDAVTSIPNWPYLIRMNAVMVFVLFVLKLVSQLL